MRAVALLIVLVAFTPVFAPAHAAEPSGIVALVTDYGADSIYVGMLHGVIYTKHRDATVVDVTHSVPPFDVTTGAHLLAEVVNHFPEGAVFCAVVDPGVGGERRPIAVRTESGHYFVGPDNGLMYLAVTELGLAEARELTNQALWRDGAVSHTFHGRDIFGPVAGSLAGGAPFDSVGPVIEEITALDVKPARLDDGVIEGRVLRTDDYGNVVTNVTEAILAELGAEQGGLLTVTIEDQTFEAPWRITYSDVEAGERLLLIQSAGFVELAINLGNLAETAGVEPGDGVRIALNP